MVAEDFPREHDQDYALALIQGRIAEKRLFEARFLCRRLGEGLGAASREVLARELDEALAQVEQLRRQVQALVAQGDHVQAGLLYNRIEEIAVDVPGVAEERQALAGAEALAARLHKPRAEEPAPQPAMVASAAVEESGEIAAPPTPQVAAAHPSPVAEMSRSSLPQRSSLFSWKLLAAGGLALGVLALLLLWGRQSTSPPVSATSTIVIQPLQPVTTAVAPVAPPPPAPEPAPVVEEPSPPVTPAPAPSTPALHLGSLQIKSDKKIKR